MSLAGPQRRDALAGAYGNCRTGGCRHWASCDGRDDWRTFYYRGVREESQERVGEESHEPVGREKSRAPVLSSQILVLSQVPVEELAEGCAAVAVLGFFLGC